MRPADSRKQLEFAGLGAGAVLGVALAALGLRQALTDAGVMPVLAVMLGGSIIVLCGLALARLAYMERRAARLRQEPTPRRTSGARPPGIVTVSGMAGGHRSPEVGKPR